MTHNLDLRGIACPLNFVKTKIYLDTIAIGEILTVILDAGEPIESVRSSVMAEGHEVNTPDVQGDGSYRLTITKIVCILVLGFYYFLYAATLSQAATLNGNTLVNKNIVESSHTTIGPNAALKQEIKSAKEAILLSPIDTEKRLHLARLLRRSGNTKQAAIEYLNATVVSPNCSAAYHELVLSNPSIGQIDEAIARLSKLDEMKPKQLSTKMGLSELYEHKDDYYQAARVLVDLQYSQNIPAKYVPQIASRVHMLLGKTKDVRTTEKAIEQKTNIEESESSSTPIPMPDVTVKTDAPTDRLRNTRVKEGYGHAQLLP